MKLNITLLSKSKRLDKIARELCKKSGLNLCSELTEDTDLVITDDNRLIAEVEKWLFRNERFKRAILSNEIKEKVKLNSYYLILDFYSQNIMNNLISIINLIRKIKQSKEDNWVIKHKYFQLTEQICQANRKNELLKKLTIYDSKLHCFNYRYFRMQFQKEVNQAIRFHLPLTFIMIDVDNFKHYNDVKGHMKGDIALVNIVKILKNNIRDIDYLFRFGGDEFIIIIPRTDLHDAINIAERLRRKVENLNISWKFKGKTYQITISLGITTFSSEELLRELTHRKVIELIDEATYKAKDMGGNMIFIHHIDKKSPL